MIKHLFFRPLLTMTATLCLAASSPAYAGSYEDTINAAENGDTATLVGLLKRGIDPDTVDADGNTLLIIAVRAGHVDMAETLLGYRPKLGYRNRAGDSALMQAVLHGNEQLVELLLVNGVPVNHDGWTPLHYAALEGRLGILDRLLAAGADVNALTPNKSNALMLAARNGHIDIVRRLLETPVSLNQKNDKGVTADKWAESNGNTEIAKLIRETRTARARRPR